MFCGLESGEYRFACFFFYYFFPPHFIKPAVSILSYLWQMKDTKGSTDPNCQDGKGQTTWNTDRFGYCFGPTHIIARSWQCQENGGKVLRSCDKARFLRTKQSRRLLSEQHSNVYANKSRWTFQNRFEWSLACDDVFCAPEPSKTWNCLRLSM